MPVKSDNTSDQPLMRFHETGANFFLPGGLLNTNLLRFRSAGETLALFAGPLGFGLDLRALTSEQTRQLKKIIAAYKQVRPWINADYYALFPQTTREAGWNGWEFLDPATQTGFVCVYRPSGTACVAAELHLRGVDRNRAYLLIDVLSGRTETVAGSVLPDGLRIELAPDSARLLRFRPATAPGA